MRTHVRTLVRSAARLFHTALMRLATAPHNAMTDDAGRGQALTEDSQEGGGFLQKTPLRFTQAFIYLKNTYILHRIYYQLEQN